MLEVAHLKVTAIMVSIVVLTIGILSTAVCAQQTLYGQCGGEGQTIHT